MSQRRIRIVNPVSDQGTTTFEIARAYVRRGHARWVDSGRAVEFIETHHGHCSAERSHGEIVSNPYRHLRGVPVIQPEELLAPVQKRHFGWRAGVSRTVTRQPAAN